MKAEEGVLLSSGKLFLTGFIFSASLLAISVYMQYGMQLEPCPLCILQRLAVAVVAVLFLLATLHNPGVSGVKLYSSLIMLVGAAGGAISARHVWLQSLPADQVPSCGPGLDFIVDNFPPIDAFRMIFSGSGECAEVSWSFLGLSIPAWTLVAFCFMALLALMAIVQSVKRNDWLI